MPKTLIIYFTLTRQVGRVADTMARALEARGCMVTKALIEFTDERWVPKLSEFPMKRPLPQLVSILPAQLRHKTGEIRIPPAASAGDYDLVILASPTWWFQTSMPMRSYLESPEARTVLRGTPTPRRAPSARRPRKPTARSPTSCRSGCRGATRQAHPVGRTARRKPCRQPSSQQTPRRHPATVYHGAYDNCIGKSTIRPRETSSAPREFAAGGRNLLRDRGKPFPPEVPQTVSEAGSGQKLGRSSDVWGLPQRQM